MAADPAEEKRLLRAEIRARRKTMPDSLRAKATGEFTDHLRTLVDRAHAKSIACYLPSREEPNTRPFLNWAIESAVKTLLPITREDGLLDWVEADGSSETIGLFGLPEAVGDVLGPIAINYVDLIIVPALSVAWDGARLGQGKGYYDKMLGSMDRCPPVWAVVFDDEFVQSLPQEANDRRVQGCVTPTQLVKCTSSKI